MSKDLNIYNFSEGLDYQTTVVEMEQNAKKCSVFDCCNVDFLNNVGLCKTKGYERVLINYIPVGIKFLAIESFSLNGFECIAYVLANGNCYYYDGVAPILVCSGLITTAEYKIIGCYGGFFCSSNSEAQDNFFYKKGNGITLSGVVSTSIGSKIVTGVNTLFITELIKGSKITINGETKVVVSITSDTSLTVDTIFSQNNTNVSSQSNDVNLCNCERTIGGKVYKIRGTAVTYFKESIWIGDEKGIYKSALGKTHDWETAKDAFYSQGFHNSTSRVTALSVYKSYLVIYKEDEIYLLGGDTADSTSTSQSLFSIIKYGSKGTCGSKSVSDYIEQQFFFSDGLLKLSQFGELQNLKVADSLTLKVNSYFSKYLDREKLEDVILIRNNREQVMFCYFPQKNGKTGCFVLNAVNNGLTRRELPKKVNNAFEYNGDVYITTDDGYLYKDYSGKTFDGEVIEFFVLTPFFHFGKPDIPKEIEFLNIIVDENANNHFIWYYNTDYSQVNKSDEETILIYDSDVMLWDISNWDETNFATSSITKEMLIIPGSNLSVQIGIKGTELNHDFSLIGITFKEIEIDD